jgi:hypothetical protein
MEGKEIFSKKINGDVSEMDLKQLDKGTYFVLIITSESLTTVQISKE